MHTRGSCRKTPNEKRPKTEKDIKKNRHPSPHAPSLVGGRRPCDLPPVSTPRIAHQRRVPLLSYRLEYALFPQIGLQLNSESF